MLSCANYQKDNIYDHCCHYYLILIKSCNIKLKTTLAFSILKPYTQETGTYPNREILPSKMKKTVKHKIGILFLIPFKKFFLIQKNYRIPL